MMDGTLNFDRNLSGVSLNDVCKIRSTQCWHSVRGRTIWDDSQRGRWCIFDVRCCTVCNYRLVSGRLNRATVTQDSLRYSFHIPCVNNDCHTKHNHSAKTCLWIHKSQLIHRFAAYWEADADWWLM